MNLKNNTAITLTELLVSTILIGVVMLGIVAIDFAIRQSQRGTSRNALVAMRTSAIMLHITKNAAAVVGSRNDPGIVKNATNLWVRRGNPPGWISYTYRNPDLLFCVVPDFTTICPSGTGDENLGTLTDSGFTTNFVKDDSLGNQDFYLEVTLQNRFDPTAPVTSGNEFENPQYTLTSRISPASSSY